MDSDDDFGAFDSAPAAVAAAPPPVGFGAFEEPATSFPTRPPDHPTPAPPDAGAPEASFGAFATAEDPAPRPTVDDDASDDDFGAFAAVATPPPPAAPAETRGVASPAPPAPLVSAAASPPLSAPPPATPARDLIALRGPAFAAAAESALARAFPPTPASAAASARRRRRPGGDPSANTAVYGDAATGRPAAVLGLEAAVERAARLGGVRDSPAFAAVLEACGGARRSKAAGGGDSKRADEREGGEERGEEKKRLVDVFERGRISTPPSPPRDPPRVSRICSGGWT